MSQLYYFSLKDFLANNTLDDDARWFLELENTIELNPIREYKNVEISEEPYEHSINLDLETRVPALIEMIEYNKKSKRHDNHYLKTLAIKLKEKCHNQNQLELEQQLDDILLTI